MRKWLLIVLVVLVSVVPVYAQENILTYGDEVEGEITNRAFEVEYTFKGEAGDVVLIQMIPEDTFRGLSNPSIILLDEDNNVLETVGAAFGTATLIYDLEKDGNYIILATRRDGRTGDSQGAYTLMLDKLEVFEGSGQVEATIDNESTLFFAVRTDSTFTLTYTRTGGTFYPTVVISQLVDSFFGNSNLGELAVLSGSRLASGSLVVEPEGDLYIVTVSSQSFSFSFSAETADFVIEIEID